MICELYLPCMSSTSIVVKVHVSYVFNCMASDNCLQVKSQLCTSVWQVCMHMRLCVAACMYMCASACVCVCACVHICVHLLDHTYSKNKNQADFFHFIHVCV